MILLPPLTLVDVPDMAQAITTGRLNDDPRSVQWFDLSKVAVGEEFKLDTPKWPWTLRRVDGQANVEIVSG